MSALKIREFVQQVAQQAAHQKFPNVQPLGDKWLRQVIVEGLPRVYFFVTSALSMGLPRIHVCVLPSYRVWMGQWCTRFCNFCVFVSQHMFFVLFVVYKGLYSILCKFL